jgi:alanine racemase
MKKHEIMPATWIELSRQALRNNVRSIREGISPELDFMAVVKANAYGHGLIPILEILEQAEVDWYAVFDFADAVSIRERSLRPVLVLSGVGQECFAQAARDNIAITISTKEALRSLKTYAGVKKLHVHLKVDTGLGRQGFTNTDFAFVKKELKQLPKQVLIEGLYTHFAATEEKSFDAYTMFQYTQIEQWRSLLTQLGFHPLVHAGATSGTLRFPHFPLDIARIGIGLYGLWPSSDVEKESTTIDLEPVLSWYAKINEVKKLPKGAKIAYNCTKVLNRDSVVALLPIGYWDGVPRSLSNKGYVLINGEKAPILGRVMMNMCVVDVTDCGRVRVGDTATIIGTDKRRIVSAEEVAALAGTINYEVVTRINPLIPRIVA